MDEDDLYSNVLKERANYNHVRWRFPPDRPTKLKHHTTRPFSGKRLGVSKRVRRSSGNCKVMVDPPDYDHKPFPIRPARALPLVKVFRPRKKKTNLLKERM